MICLLSDVASAVDGRLLGADVALDGVSTDTRHALSGQMFVALKGERFDAHDFLAQAAGQGIAAALVDSTDKLPVGLPAVLVEDTRLALGRFAAVWRARFDIPLLAVTGSNGKTTTKEMIASILKAQWGDSVLVTRGNFNNDIGLPLTLLGMNDSHRAAVIEMGMNHPGEIDYLADIGVPTVAVVTNAQRAHLQGMGDLDEVAREKGTIFKGLKVGGVAVINADDPYADFWCAMAANEAPGCAILTFGIDHPADVRGIVSQSGLEMHLHLSAREGEVELTLSVPGRHNARNAVAAAAAGLAAGVPLATVARGLAAFCGVKGRLQQRTGENGALILDDTYNANPDSVRAGINVLAATVGRKILVLGDMGEIGDASAQCHDEIGGYAKSQGIDLLFALGEGAQVAARNFGLGGRHFRHHESLIAALRPELASGTAVLVKGSRFMKMERIADAISLPSDSPPVGGQEKLADAASGAGNMTEAA